MPELNTPESDASTFPKASARSLLFGDDGLRAGWSLLLYLVLVGVLAAASVPLLKHLFPSNAPRAAGLHAELRPGIAAVGETLQLAWFAVPALIMSLIERRPFGRYGLTAQRMLPDFLQGLFWGFTTLSALVGTLFLTHHIAFDGLLLHGWPALIFALEWAGIFLLVGMGEEFLFRGYLQYTLARGIAGIVRAMDPRNRFGHRISFLGAAFLLSIVLFTLAHMGNGGENAGGLLAVALAGAVFAFSLYRTGSLWWGIGTHTAWDWAQSYLYGTPDSGNVSFGRLLSSHPVGSKLLSGGSDGPEGSLFVIPTLLLTVLIIHWTLPQRAYPLTTDQMAPAGEQPQRADSASETWKEPPTGSNASV